MFEFAIEQSRKRPPTRRFMASVFASITFHCLIVAALIQFPELLRPGLVHWFRPPSLGASLSPKETWRTVTFVGSSTKMEMPAADVLKRYVYSWDREASKGNTPAFRVQWSAPLSLPDEAEKTAKPVPGLQEPMVAPAASLAAAAPPAGDPSAVVPNENQVSGAPFEVKNDPSANSGSEKTVTIFLPSPSKGDVNPGPAKTGTPSRIPSETKVSENRNAAAAGQKAGGQEAHKVFENEQAAIRTEGSGFFDTRGFPLGEYASAIIERIKGNWSIPSNLRSSSGRSTVIFFIEKDGRISGLRIVTPSGSNSLDLAAMESVLISNPFPPLPTGFPGDHVGAKFIFSYNERP